MGDRISYWNPNFAVFPRRDLIENYPLLIGLYGLDGNKSLIDKEYEKQGIKKIYRYQRHFGKQWENDRGKFLDIYVYWTRRVKEDLTEGSRTYGLGACTMAVWELPKKPEDVVIKPYVDHTGYKRKGSNCIYYNGYPNFGANILAVASDTTDRKILKTLGFKLVMMKFNQTLWILDGRKQVIWRKYPYKWNEIIINILKAKEAREIEKDKKVMKPEEPEVGDVENRLHPV